MIVFNEKMKDLKYNILMLPIIFAVALLLSGNQTAASFVGANMTKGWAQAAII